MQMRWHISVIAEPRGPFACVKYLDCFCEIFRVRNPPLPIGIAQAQFVLGANLDTEAKFWMLPCAGATPRIIAGQISRFLESAPLKFGFNVSNKLDVAQF
jgi:hypothetical protein